MKFRPTSLMWFLANRAAAERHAKNPSVSYKRWLAALLPPKLTLTRVLDDE